MRNLQKGITASRLLGLTPLLREEECRLWPESIWMRSVT